MKRCFYFLMAAIGLLLSTACSNEDELSRGFGNEALVSFNVELSGGMQTKAISDGTTAKNLVVGVFEVDEKGTVGNELKDLRPKNVTFDESLSTTVTFNLVKGKTYSFVFWAQAQEADATSPYDVTDLKSIKVSYENAKANDESRDAFLGVEKIKVDGSFEKKVTLKRPFAQLNFLTNDIDKAAEAGLPINDQTKSSITISNAATTLNPFTNTVSGEQDVTFAAAAIPAASETYEINGTHYRYLGTTYFLVNAGGDNADAGKKQTTLSSANLKVDGVQGDGLTVSNVPVQWNYRTNIYGSLLTATGDFNVTIKPDYEGDHNEEVKTKQVATVDQVDEAIAAGATEVIVTEAPKEDATITIPKVFETGNETTISISIPETTAKVTVSEGSENNNAPKEVVISCPNMSELEINLPNSTVKLEGSFGSITATTADNTLIIPEDVKVTSLTVNKGNVEIYGQFDIQITKAKGYTGTITYFVSTAEQLAAFASKVNAGTSFSKEFVKLANDIDLNNKNWTPIGNVSGYPSVTFAGTFDGQNYTISNLTASSTDADYASAGLFGSTIGMLKNVKLQNVNISSTHYAGALLGYSSTNNGAVIENCHVDGGSITSQPEQIGSGYDNGDKAGGLIGYCVAGDKVTGCSAKNLTITAYRDLGGLVGASAATLSNNTVSNITLKQDNTNAYKDETISTVGAIVGRKIDRYSESGCTASNVTAECEAAVLTTDVSKIDVLKLRGSVELLTTTSLRNSIQLIGVGEDVTITGKPLYLAGENTVIKNIKFNNGLEGKESAVYATDQKVKNITLEGCKFENAAWDAIQITSLALQSVSFKDCYFKNDNKITTSGHKRRYIHIELDKEVDAKVAITGCTFENVSATYCNDSAITLYGIMHANMSISGNIVKGDGADNITSNMFWISNGATFTTFTADELKKMFVYQQ